MAVSFYDHRFLGRVEDATDFIDTLQRHIDQGHWRVWLDGTFYQRAFHGWYDAAETLTWVRQQKGPTTHVTNARRR